MAARAREISGDRPATRSDAYTGILILSLLAQIVAVTFFYLDWSQYPTTKPPALPALPTFSTAAGAAGTPAGAPAGAPGNPGAGVPGKQ